MNPRTEIIDDNAPLTLERACEVYFGGAIKPSTLLAEAQRGRLQVEKIGRRYFITIAGIREMRSRCRVDLSAEARGFGSSRSGETGTEALKPQFGSFATARSSAAQAALQQTVQALSARSSNTLPKSTIPEISVGHPRGH